jgi:hypothetical protein
MSEEQLVLIAVRSRQEQNFDPKSKMVCSPVYLKTIKYIGELVMKICF